MRARIDMLTVTMSHSKFEAIDSSISELIRLAEFQSHSGMADRIRNMDDRELVTLAAVINELAHDWCELKGIRCN